MPILYLLTTKSMPKLEGEDLSMWRATKKRACEDAKTYSLDDEGWTVTRVDIPATKRGVLLAATFTCPETLREHLGADRVQTVATFSNGTDPMKKSRLAKLTNKYWEVLADKERIERDPVGVELELRKLEKEVHRLNEKRKKRQNEAREGGG